MKYAVLRVALSSFKELEKCNSLNFGDDSAMHTQSNAADSN